MYIQNLKIKNIRCLKELKLNNFKKNNFIIGSNAQGKSSILESIYILSTSKSNRTFKDKEFINIDENDCLISADIKREKKPDCTLEIVIGKNHKKAFFIDNTKKNKIGDAIGELNCVIFSANDIEMIKGDPSSRRNYLNLEISQIYPLYIQEYVNYKKTLIQRNNLLKEIKNNECLSYDLLDILDIQLSVWGTKLYIKRKNFIDKVSIIAKEIYTNLTNNDFSVKYQSFLKENTEKENEIQSYLLEQIKQKREIDIKTGTSVCGPHRDDIDIKVNNLSVKNYGSGGEMRSAAYALKMSEINIIKEITGEYPVVLLDDFMSELDYSRREKAMEFAGKNCQIFITTTHLDNVKYNSEDTNIYTITKN